MVKRNLVILIVLAAANVLVWASATGCIKFPNGLFGSNPQRTVTPAGEYGGAEPEATDTTPWYLGADVLYAGAAFVSVIGTAWFGKRQLAKRRK